MFPQSSNCWEAIFGIIIIIIIIISASTETFSSEISTWVISIIFVKYVFIVILDGVSLYMVGLMDTQGLLYT